MAKTNLNCDACSELRENAAAFLVNGVTDDICTSLQNNTGFNPDLETPRTDCEDLDAANDCLIGMADGQLEAYDTCDWKKFMHNFIPNIWNVLKAIICSICGLWTHVEKLECEVDHLSTAQVKELHAYEDDDPTKPALNGFKICDGVEVRTPGIGSAATRVVIMGGMAYFTGALAFNGNMPTDYTNGQTVAWTDFWAHGTQVTTVGGYTTVHGVCPPRGFLIYQYEVKACDFGFSNIYPGHLMRAADGEFDFVVHIFKKGDPTYPDYGSSTPTGTYNPTDDDMILIQIRMGSMMGWGTGSGNITPNGYCMVDLCKDSWEC